MAEELNKSNSISAEAFDQLDKREITILDLRGPDEVLIHPLEGAINIPFGKGFSELDNIPRDKPVYAICRVGDWSEEVVEILLDRGYDAYNVEGGYQAYRNYLQESTPADTKQESTPADTIQTATSDDIMQNEDPVYIDAKALRCPGPIVKVADTLRTLPEGKKVIVEATEDAFVSDIKVWCDRTGNELTKLEAEPGKIKAEITKRDTKIPQSENPEKNDKTFIVFSGDLDKTIAAFILANGAAAMGRKVTLFFTFWGLNILRRPKKVPVAKSFIEKMFGFMMPRGTYQLGLSRMNMGGAGAKMIRSIMKQKGISSLEELIESAKEHGVRLVACQMSMDIMGIHQEELTDGIELGGVATFIGSGEQSDISLFI